MKLISNDLNHLLFKEIPRPLEKAIIISPYISEKTVIRFLKYMDTPAAITVITTFNRENFITGASSLATLSLLVDNNISVYALNDLHTKAYIFNNKKCLVGSANFTENALNKNHELLLVLDQPHECNEIITYASNLLKQITSNGNWIITKQLIQLEIEAIQKLTYTSPHKKEWGATLESPTVNPIVLSVAAGDTIDIIETVNIHAHPVKPSFKYKNTNLITFRRRSGGQMDNVYKIEDTLELTMSDWQSQLNTTYILASEKDRISRYIVSRYANLGFDESCNYKFYILKPYTSLPNKPRPEKNSPSHRYYNLADLTTTHSYIYPAIT